MYHAKVTNQLNEMALIPANRIEHVPVENKIICTFRNVRYILKLDRFSEFVAVDSISRNPVSTWSKCTGYRCY